MYSIVYLFGKKIQEYLAFCEKDRDDFLRSLTNLEIRVLAVRFRLC